MKDQTPAPMLAALPRESCCQMNEIGIFIDTHNLFEKYQEWIPSSYNSVTALSSHLTALYCLD